MVCDKQPVFFHPISFSSPVHQLGCLSDLLPHSLALGIPCRTWARATLCRLLVLLPAASTACFSLQNRCDVCICSLLVPTSFLFYQHQEVIVLVLVLLDFHSSCMPVTTGVFLENLNFFHKTSFSYVVATRHSYFCFPTRHWIVLRWNYEVEYRKRELEMLAAGAGPICFACVGFLVITSIQFFKTCHFAAMEFLYSWNWWEALPLRLAWRSFKLSSMNWNSHYETKYTTTHKLQVIPADLPQLRRPESTNPNRQHQ